MIDIWGASEESVLVGKLYRKIEITLFLPDYNFQLKNFLPVILTFPVILNQL